MKNRRSKCYSTTLEEVISGLCDIKGEYSGKHELWPLHPWYGKRLGSLPKAKGSGSIIRNETKW